MTYSYSNTAEFFENSGILTGIDKTSPLSDRIEGAHDTLEAACWASIEGFDLNVAIKFIANAFGIEQHMLFLRR